MMERPVNLGTFSRGCRPPARRGRLALVLTALGAFLMAPGEAHATPGEILVITDVDVALYAAPGPKSKVIERLDKNDRIMEFERRDGWVRGMLFGAIGKEGWVAARYLKPETDDREDGGGPGARSEAPDGASPDEPATRTQSADGEGAYVSRRRQPVYLYCVDCGLPRRHESRRHRDRPHSEVRKVPRHHFRDRKPSPVIRIVPKPAPV